MARPRLVPGESTVSMEQGQSGAIHVSVWPQSTIQGETGFSTSILSHYQTIGHFDAVVVTVPDERRVISVETIESGDDVRSQAVVPVQHKMELQTNLENWFRENWMPPVMESLPVHGYLPGNRRVLQLRVSGKHEKIQDVQLINVANESFLVADVRGSFPTIN